MLIFVWEAASRSEYEQIHVNDPSLTRHSWAINWVLFFALPALLVMLFGIAANSRPPGAGS